MSDETVKNKRISIPYLVVGGIFAVIAIASLLKFALTFSLCYIAFSVVLAVTSGYFLLFGFGKIKRRSNRTDNVYLGIFLNGAGLVLKVVICLVILSFSYLRIWSFNLIPISKPLYIYKSDVESENLNLDVFPSEIPQSAKNIKYVRRDGFFHAGSEMILYFKADDSYISECEKTAKSKAVSEIKISELFSEGWDYDTVEDLPPFINLPQAVNDRIENYTLYYYEDEGMDYSGIYISDIDNSVCFFESND